ncbi:MAG: hypothetical protein J6Y62_07135 [Clostridia bacterium]|nr:hypothetical protein [Clostridia bacterium]
MNREDMDVLLDRSYRYEGLDHGAEADYCSAQLAELYKGCGPDRWPEFAAHAIGKCGELFEPALLVYDADFRKSDGTVQGLHQATQRFKRNVMVIFHRDFPWFSFLMFLPSHRKRRHEIEVAVKAMFVAVSDGYVRRAWEAEAFQNGCHEKARIKAM